ncbi:MAG: glycosyltransferase family 4 protein, partial [Bacteroidales bacterium]
MKVLMVHNFYQSSSPTGEDVVFRNEIELLKKNGVAVVTYTKHNDEIKDYGFFRKMALPFKNIWSMNTYKEVKRLIKKEKPDIAHFHNIFYLISPSAYYACKKAGVPVVQTLHNFRIFCANGLLMRNGQVCEECVPEEENRSEVIGYRDRDGKTGDRLRVIGDGNRDIESKAGNRLWVIGDRDKDYVAGGKIEKEGNGARVIGHRFKIIKNAIKYGCYRNSKFYSLPVALMQYIHWVKKTWINKVDAYIALTEFGKKKFIEAGLPAYKIFVKPNFLANPPEPNYSHKNYAVFLGRLSVEKGLNVLVEAFKLLGKKYQELGIRDHTTPNPQHPSPITYAFKIKIVGDGPLKESLEQIVKNGNIEGIEFTGRKTFNECMELLKGARFLIMPAICYEAFPLTVLE